MALFDGSVGKSDNAILDTVANGYFDCDNDGIDALYGSAISLYKHVVQFLRICQPWQLTTGNVID
jgi:hypothetical protein